MGSCLHSVHKRVFDPIEYGYADDQWGKAHKRYWICKDCYHKGIVIVWDEPAENEWVEINRKRVNRSIVCDL